MRAMRVVLAAVLVLAWAEQAGADQAIEVHLTDKVIPGQQPSITVSAFQDLKTLELDLRRDDGKRIKLTKINVPRDSKRVFDLPQTKGRHHYRGTLKVTFHYGEGGTMKLDFTAMIMPPMGLQVRQGALDLAARPLLLRSRRKLNRVH